MAQIIKLKSNSTASAIPLVGDLIAGELAVNTYDGKIFLKKNNGAESIVEIGADAATLNNQAGAYYLDYNNFTNTPVIPDPITVDATIIDASTNPVQGNAVFDALALKQDSLGFTPENVANKGIANGYAPLDAGIKIPSSYLPAIAITNVSTVATEVAQLGLTAQEGDVAIRTDLSKTYIHNGGIAGTMADWSEMATPTDVVLSVNGQTGAITLTTTDVTEGTNLYYTDARVLSYVGGVINDTGTTTGDLWSASKINTFVSAAISDAKAISSTVNPAATNDVASGYYIGQVWVNTTTDKAYILVDGTTAAAVWFEIPSSQISSGSNVGTAGVGVYKGINGASLEFKKLNNTTANNITIADDVANNEVDISINFNDAGTGTTDVLSANAILTRTINGGTY